jgi:acyl-CoA carboxylase subunit beta
VNAREVLAALLDAGTFRSWDTTPAGVRPDPAYAADLAAAREWTGLDESVITGEGLIGGHRVAVAASEFGFLGGSIGVAAGQRLTLAAERATAGRLPLIALPASGGTRMQEGTVAFLQMIKITAAVTAHQAAHLPYLVYLRHPTTGGVLASWASLGHVTLAEPGALIGFLGPRVYQALHHAPFPDGIQTAENLHAHGLIDAVVSADGLGELITSLLTAITPGHGAAPWPGTAGSTARPAAAGGLAGTGGQSGTETPGRTGQLAGLAGTGEHSGTRQPGRRTGAHGGPGRPDGAAGTSETGRPAGTTWTSVLRTRQAGYPGARDLIRAAATDVVILHETGLILAVARIGGFPCVLAAQDRHGPPPGPAALRVAQRGVRLAEGLRRPLVTVIDTPGAELSPEAEQDGLAGEIARCLAALLAAEVPTISVLLGEGTGGAALALLPADRTIAGEHAWLAPLAPEGASAIVYRDTSHAAELAARQGIGAADLAADGIVDEVIPETPGHPGGLCAGLGIALQHALAALTAEDEPARAGSRARRVRGLGAEQARVPGRGG